MLSERLYDGLRIPDSYGILAFINILGEIWRLNSDIIYLNFTLSKEAYEEPEHIVVKINVPLGIFEDTLTGNKEVTLDNGKKLKFKLIGPRLTVFCYDTVYLYGVDMLKAEFNSGNRTSFFNPITHKWFIYGELDTKIGDTVYLLRDPMDKVYGVVSKYDIESPSSSEPIVLESDNLTDYVDNIQCRMHNEKFDNLIETIEPNLDAKHYLSAVLLTKGENEYLLEFLEENTKAGFDYFYIYDNNDSDNSVKEFLKDSEWINKCTIIPIQQIKNIQYEAYRDFMVNYKNETTWVSFIDTDEIYTGDVKEFCEAIQDECAVATIHWTIHNANGLIDKPKGKQFENFTKIIPYGLPNIIGKIIAQPKFLSTMYVHDVSIHPAYKNCRPEYEHKDDINYIPQFEIKLHHFITRSAEEWVNKILRGSCDPSALRKVLDFLMFNKDIKEEYMKYLKDRNIDLNLSM